MAFNYEKAKEGRLMDAMWVKMCWEDTSISLYSATRGTFSNHIKFGSYMDGFWEKSNIMCDY